MRNAAAIKAKTKAHNTCQECGSTELIQTHHRIPGDDSTIVVLCGECHSRKHPNTPKALFLSVLRRSYWFNKSAASLARESGLHPRTIIRAAKRLGILPGDELSPWDEELIRNNIPKLQWKQKSKKDKLLSPKTAAVLLGVSQRDFWFLASKERPARIIRHVTRTSSRPYLVEFFSGSEIERLKNKKATGG